MAIVFLLGFLLRPDCIKMHCPMGAVFANVAEGTGADELRDMPFFTFFSVVIFRGFVRSNVVRMPGFNSVFPFFAHLALLPFLDSLSVKTLATALLSPQGPSDNVEEEVRIG
jgi:hypothetical protein